MHCQTPLSYDQSLVGLQAVISDSSSRGLEVAVVHVAAPTARSAVGDCESLGSLKVVATTVRLALTVMNIMLLFAGDEHHVVVCG